MPISIELEYRDEILFVTASGEYTLDSAKATFVELLKSLVDNSADKVLVDCRLLKNISKSTLTTYDYAKTAADELHNQNLHPKLAYLHTPENFNQMARFGELVAINRGVIVHVFQDHDAAVQWLHGN